MCYKNHSPLVTRDSCLQRIKDDLEAEVICLLNCLLQLQRESPEETIELFRGTRNTLRPSTNLEGNFNSNFLLSCLLYSDIRDPVSIFNTREKNGNTRSEARVFFGEALNKVKGTKIIDLFGFEASIGNERIMSSHKDANSRFNLSAVGEIGVEIRSCLHLITFH